MVPLARRVLSLAVLTHAAPLGPFDTWAQLATQPQLKSPPVVAKLYLPSSAVPAAKASRPTWSAPLSEMAQPGGTECNT